MLRDPGQISQLALLAYEHNLQFTFTRAGDRIDLILFSGPAVIAPLAEGTDIGL
jgi:hypothetical protein